MFYDSKKKFAIETDSTPTGHQKNLTRAPDSDAEQIMRTIFGSSMNTPKQEKADDSEEVSLLEKRRAIIERDILQCVNYLNKRGIATPKHFDRDLAAERNVFFSSRAKVIPLVTIDAIIRACEMWKPYITADSFDKLVCEEVKSMFRIEACALSYTNSGSELKSYIGNFATLSTLPPLGMSTSVNYYGKISAYGV